LQTLGNETGCTVVRKEQNDSSVAQRPANIFWRDSCEVDSYKGHNRAVHPGEKSEKECKGVKVSCADLQIISTALCSVGLVNPDVIEMQLNQ
jgi:hypothetical protein